MIEAQRLAYLEAMGVDSYMPRRLLTLAPEPLLCETLAYAPPAQDEAPLIEEEAGVSKPAKAASPAAPAQRAERPAFDWGDQAEPAAAKAGTRRRQAAQADAKAFKLRASIAVSDQGWLIADASSATLSATQMMPWAGQLIRAMTGQAGQSRYSVFNWPPPRTQSLAVTEAEASESFAALLTGAMERDQVRCVLLLGDVWRDWVLPPEVQVIRGPSIEQMRQDPQAKALLWQSMRGFKQALS